MARRGAGVSPVIFLIAMRRKVAGGTPAARKPTPHPIRRYGGGVTFALFVGAARCRLPFDWK